MIRASDIHVKEKANEVSIIEIANAVIDPRTMVVCNNSRDVKNTIPRRAYPFAARNYRVVSIVPRYSTESCYSLVALSAMMGSRRFVLFASTAEARVTC